MKFSHTVPYNVLKAALVCASTKETRYYPNGVMLDSAGRCVSTDGHVMFAARNIEVGEDAPAQVIIPREAIKDVLKLVKARDRDYAQIGVDLAGGMLHAFDEREEGDRYGAVPFTPVDGTFPDWGRVVPYLADVLEATPNDNPAGFSSTVLKDLLDVATALMHGKRAVELAFHQVAARDPAIVTFDGYINAFCAVMPLRRSETFAASDLDWIHDAAEGAKQEQSQ